MPYNTNLINFGSSKTRHNLLIMILCLAMGKLIMDRNPQTLANLQEYTGTCHDASFTLFRLRELSTYQHH
jgi:hypothetical protein